MIAKFSRDADVTTILIQQISFSWLTIPSGELQPLYPQLTRRSKNSEWNERASNEEEKREKNTMKSNHEGW